MEPMHANRTVFFAINGIRNALTEQSNWGSPFSHEMLVRGELAEEYRYKTPAVFRFVHQGRIVNSVIARLRRHALNGNDIEIIGHSNGCEIGRRAIQQGKISVRRFWMMAAAVDCDFERNGLNEYLHWHPNCEVVIYTSKRDYVLRYIATASRWATFGLAGYGSLGAFGPKNVDPYVQPQVRVIARDDYTHGDYVTPNNLLKQMNEMLDV